MIRRLRLFSGLVMLAYVTMHLLNHAVGLISLEAMENVLCYIFRIWTNRPAQLLLYCSFLALNHNPLHLIEADLVPAAIV